MSLKISYKEKDFYLYRCLFTPSKLVHQFRVKKGLFSYTFGSSDITIRPFDGYWDIITITERLPTIADSNWLPKDLKGRLIEQISRIESGQN